MEILYGKVTWKGTGGQGEENLWRRKKQHWRDAVSFHFILVSRTASFQPRSFLSFVCNLQQSFLKHYSHHSSRQRYLFTFRSLGGWEGRLHDWSLIMCPIFPLCPLRSEKCKEGARINTARECCLFHTPVLIAPTKTCLHCLPLSLLMHNKTPPFTSYVEKVPVFLSGNQLPALFDSLRGKEYNKDNVPG